ncbi:MAG: MFS transporter [Pseudomonadota bacterium]
MTSRQYILLAVCVALFALGQFHRAAGAIAAPLWANDFALSAEQLGTVIGVIFIATIVTQAPIGAALDRFGPRLVLTVTIALVALGTYACLWATGYETLLIARIAIGMGLASTGIGMYLILARNFPAEDFGYLNGLMVTLGGIGGLAATYPLAALVESYGWRPVFAGLTFGTLALAAAMFLATKPGATDAKPDQDTTTLKDLLATPGFPAILLLSIVTYAPIVTITGLWGGPYFTDVHGLSLSATGAILFALFASTMVAGTVFGILDKRGVSRRLTTVGAALASAICFAATALFTAQGPWVAATLFFAAIFAQNFYVPLLAELKDRVPDAAIGRATSLFSIVAVGAIPVLQTAYGAILARTPDTAAGHENALLALAALIATLALAYLAATRRA